MGNNLSTSEAGQRLLSRVYQIITNANQVIKINKSKCVDSVNHDIIDNNKYLDMVNQEIVVARVNSQLGVSDIKTLGKIFFANSQRQSNKLFIGNGFLRNIKDLRTLDDILSDPNERNSFIENADIQQATNVLPFPK